MREKVSTTVYYNYGIIIIIITIPEDFQINFTRNRPCSYV